MIQAGGFIDSTLGVRFGLATLTAAAMGQVVSDVSGVLCGDALESYLQRLKIIKPTNLSLVQRQLSICRRVKMAGAVLGIITGCALGATSLLLVDLEVHERSNEFGELRQILCNMFQFDEGDDLKSGSYTIYALDGSRLGINDSNGVVFRSLRSVKEGSHAMECMQSSSIVRDIMGESTMCIPVKSASGDVIAVIELKGKTAMGENGDNSYTQSDEGIAKLLGCHVGLIFDKLEKLHGR